MFAKILTCFPLISYGLIAISIGRHVILGTIFVLNVNRLRNVCTRNWTYSND